MACSLFVYFASCLAISLVTIITFIVISSLFSCSFPACCGVYCRAWGHKALVRQPARVNPISTHKNKKGLNLLESILTNKVKCDILNTSNKVSHGISSTNHKVNCGIPVANKRKRIGTTLLFATGNLILYSKIITNKQRRIKMNQIKKRAVGYCRVSTNKIIMEVS